MTSFPKNVLGFDFTAPEMDGPPAVRTCIGYHCWVDTADQTNYRSIRVDYYVDPDGSASIVRTDTPFGENEADHKIHQEEEKFLPGGWEPAFMQGDFGSRGGQAIICTHGSIVGGNPQ